MALNTTAQQRKNKDKIEFYDYFYDLKIFDFKWIFAGNTNIPIRLEYAILLSADENTISKMLQLNSGIGIKSPLINLKITT